MSRVTAAVKSAVMKLLALVGVERAVKAHVCSKVVCIKAAKTARKGAKRAKAPKTSKK